MPYGRPKYIVSISIMQRAWLSLSIPFIFTDVIWVAVDDSAAVRKQWVSVDGVGVNVGPE